ncbi:hypothetical protein IAG44_22570 [Streptomyces roseirectus]|uniref:DUF11 domain-containing protein n=1 Tax=Streptomyces roseirectus TaxID=2768066 RepID=A0A7H0IGK5_9ACTN|nr:hypothetical protein [Streptomyces roseirectus]QNP71921.1 hypothetical protein IAG44_22570 [Streptomyces roseirectus]
MNSIPVGRLRRYGVSGAAVASLALGALTALPAHAEEQTDQLWINAPSDRPVTVAPSGGEALAQSIPVGLYHDNDNFTVTDGKLTVDASGLAGVAEVLWPANCVPTGATAVCDAGDVPILRAGFVPQVTLQVRALTGAAAGASGRITYAAEATGGPDGKLVAPLDSFETNVTVGTGPDLAVATPAELDGVQPGTVVDAPFTVTNNGDQAANGFGVQMWVSYGLDLATAYPQCTSENIDDFLVHYTCAFDTVVQPGQTVALPAPLKVAVTPHALSERVDFSVEPAAGQSELQPADNGTMWRVDAANTADFAVSGSYAGGAAGETVDLTARLTDNGPAWVANISSGDPVAILDVTLPAGTSAVSVPERCEPRGAGYACELGVTIKPGQTAEFPFKVRVDSVVPDAKGKVTARPPFGAGFSFDPDTSNNSASF